MRINGTVTYYEYRTGTGFVKAENENEFYFVSREDVHSSVLLNAGMEVSFYPFMEKHDAIAKKVTAVKEYKTGYISQVITEEDLGYITNDLGKTFWFRLSKVLTSGSKTLQLNNAVQFESKNGVHPVQHAYNVVCDNRSAINKFSLTNNWSAGVALLADLAQEESWNYVNLETESYPLLKNYLVHTFQNVYEQDRIGYYAAYETDRAYACFHTGLVSRNNEDIYGVFAKNIKNTTNPFAPYDWHFSHFTDRWMNLLLQCNRTPLPASYRCGRGFDRFDPSLEIRTVVDIILRYKKDVLPKGFLLRGDDYCAVMVSKSVDHTLARVKSGKIIPVPKYFYGSIEFIIPLYFDEQPSGMALVIKRSHRDFYLANNLIPLHIAYKNARLLGPVTSEWLKPVYFSGNFQVNQDDT